MVETHVFWKTANAPFSAQVRAFLTPHKLLDKLQHKDDVVELHSNLPVDKLMTIAFVQLQVLAPTSCE